MTKEDLIEFRKDSDFWRNELLKLEYVELPEKPEFGWHPLTESSKHPDNGEELLNLYGFASMITFALFENNSKKGRQSLKAALKHANRADEYYFFLYSIKRGLDKGEVTTAQGLIAEHLQYEFERQIK